MKRKSNVRNLLYKNVNECNLKLILIMGILFIALSGYTSYALFTSTVTSSNSIALASGISRKVFDYTGDVQTYTIPETGYYKLEVWGAQGGSSLVDNAISTAGGYGGYSTGIIKLTKDTVLYVYVGGKGTDGIAMSNASGGYNGGGSGTSDNADDEAAGGGGGATHIATTTGLLSTLSSSTSNILIVAGGGGGTSGTYTAGSGGGANGGASSYTSSSYATQTAGNAFGQGQDATGVANSEGVGGGGGGYYGGYAYDISGASSGTGGSGYIGNLDLVEKYMYCYNCTTSDASDIKTYITTSVTSTTEKNKVKEGNGIAVITYMGTSYKASAATTIKNNNTIKTLAADYGTETIGTDSTKSGLYSFTENSNTDYFFRGYVNNNWVKFGQETTAKCLYNGEKVYYINDVSTQEIGEATSSTCEFQGICRYEGTLVTYSDNSILQYACSANSGEYINATPTWDTSTKDMYWRIYRITNNNEIKMIYAGNTAPNETTQYVYKASIYGISAFNEDYDSVEYVGYKYTLGSAHGTSTDSTVKTYLDDWYEDILEENYDSYISQSKYCYDRTIYSGTVAGYNYAGNGIGSTNNWYMGAKRLISASSMTYGGTGASLICSDSNDIYSLKTGLISADETSLVGLKYEPTSQAEYDANNYLISNTHYWTGSPLNGNYNFIVDYEGHLVRSYVGFKSIGVRPVITLNSNVKVVSGTDGTWEHPYEFSLN